MKQKIVVLDILGPCYHYDEKGWINSATDPLIEKLQKHGYAGKTDQEGARNEEDLIKSGKEKIYIMPGFASLVYGLSRLVPKGRAKPVVISAGTPWVLEYAIEQATRDYYDQKVKENKDFFRGKVLKPEDLVKPKDLISTVEIGSKKDPATWKKAVEKYDDPSTLAIFEDSLPNLTAAMEGIQSKMGYHITSTKQGLSQVLSQFSSSSPSLDPRLEKILGNYCRIFRGHIKEAKDHFLGYLMREQP